MSFQLIFQAREVARQHSGSDAKFRECFARATVVTVMRPIHHGYYTGGAS